MGDKKDEKQPIDPRIEFIGSFVMKTMRLKADKWYKMITYEEILHPIMDFLQYEGEQRLVWYTNNAGILIPAPDFPGASKSKMVYFIRKRPPVELTIENIRDELMFGTCSARPVDDLVTLVDEVYLPILTNPLNQKGWPDVIVREVGTQIQNFRNIIAEVQGNIINQTILPMPIVIKDVMGITEEMEAGNLNACTSEMQESIELIVIKWASQIADVLQEDCYMIYEAEPHPVPNAEFQFWLARRKNLENIYQQLCDVRVRTIASFLQKLKSVYYKQFQSTFKNVVDALNVCKDVTLYFLPLQKYVEMCESTEFDEALPLIKQLVHVICMVWSSSKYYCTNGLMVHLFKLVNNMLIAEASKHLDPGSIFQGDVDEGLLKTNRVIEIFDHYKDIYKEYREKLPAFVKDATNPQIWTFNPEIVFERLNLYLKRLMEIREIFTTAHEFLKLEKVEVGGLRSKTISKCLEEILEQFNGVFQVWSEIQFDPLDPDPNLKEFEKEKLKFEAKANVLERKLGQQFVQAFDECNDIDQVDKLIEMLGSLLHRPIIFPQIKARLMDVQDQFDKELDMVKAQFDEGLKNAKVGGGLQAIPVDAALPALWGALAWTAKLRDRIVKPTKDFEFLEYPIFENEPGKYVMNKFDTMMNKLNDFERIIFTEWCNRIKREVPSCMRNSLVARTDQHIHVNFDDVLIATLRDVKYLKSRNYEGIPDVAVELYEQEDLLWEARTSCSRIVDWYNAIISDTHATEYALVEKELQGINSLLSKTLEKMSWNSIDKKTIKEVYDVVKDLNTRVFETQANLKEIIASIRAWGTVPMFTRKDNNNQALLNVDDRDMIVNDRLAQVRESKELIDKVMEDNFRLFNNIPLRTKRSLTAVTSKEKVSDEVKEDENAENLDSVEEPEKTSDDIPTEDMEEKEPAKDIEEDDVLDLPEELDGEGEYEGMAEAFDEIVKTEAQLALFEPYEVYVDGIVGEELMNAVKISLRYIKFEVENRLNHSAPLFMVKYELQEPETFFIPNLDISSRFSFMGLMQEILISIYSMCDMIPRITKAVDTSPELHPKTEDSDVHADQEHKDEEIDDSLPTYESVLRRHAEIDIMKEEVLRSAKIVMENATLYVRKFDKYDYIWLDNQQISLAQFNKYGRTLTPEEREVFGTDAFKVKETKPGLDLFKYQINFYNNLYEDVKLMENFIDFHIWFRVDLKGFKYNLLSLINRWANLYKDYLQNHVKDSLQELEDFIAEATEILSLEVQKEEFEKLLQVLSILTQVQDREFDTDHMFDPLKQTVDMLKLFNVEFKEHVHLQLIELPEKWLKVKKTALTVKQTIGPIQAYHVDLNEKRINLFETRCKLFSRKFRSLPFFTVPCKNVNELADRTNDELERFEGQSVHLADSASLFELKPPETANLAKCRHELKMVKQIWDFVDVIESSIEEWKQTPWQKLNVEDMDQECKKFGKELRGLHKDMRSWDPYIHIEAMLKNLMTSLRAITELQNPAIRDRHWKELMQATNVQFDMNESTTLADLLALNLHQYEADVKNIVDKSVKEMAMEKVLIDLKVTWRTMAFEYDSHERSGMKVLRASEELVEILEDNQNQLQNMLSSKFIGFFKDEVSEWQNLLSNADMVIGLWFEVQRKWIYLESIFIGSEDIRNQLPADSQRFDNIDKEFKALLTTMASESNVVKATNRANLHAKLESLSADLILCEKALNDYLETKRLAFPRFYFVSSADLLDILSNGNNPAMVSKHLTKLYDSLAKLKLGGDGKSASGMVSKENEEYVKFKKTCDCSGKVESWLNRVTDSMRSTLQHSLKHAVIAYEDKSRDAWIFDWPAQPALVTTQIWWSNEVNDAFKKLEQGYENALKDYQKKQISQLNALIVLLLGNLTQGDRQKIMTVCTIDVHSRDVVAKMINERIEMATAFNWQSQLRHRWDVALNDCYINICDAQFRYDYEYLGNTPRLVITPLTDRCYITLTQSLHLIMGGAPAGPAGTGKTETTKDLGKGLGIMVYVFNCSEQMDYQSCGNIYKGLAQTGAWGCFDEFNRISVEVLSVIAVQVKCIQDAIKVKKKIFNFIGEVIKLISTVGLFITMNPGYAGRAELPENLKALFRPCAMVVPDFALICEIMLVAEGFQEARLLARKFITLYTLCKELLSKQDHYDWGLRAIKSVLVVAGALRRGDPDRPEDQVLMRALRDFNIPKIVTDDVPIFMGLIGDLFPALDIPRKRDPDFEAMVKKSAIDLHLQPEEMFILKVVQLEELFAVRHSVFVVGNAGTGKTKIWKTLNRTYHNQKRKPHYNDLNPKAVTNDELFGIINPATREWKDGLFSVIMRDQANMLGSGPKWIVLDGDIDPMWIESLNTLMDDNKVLTLASNERIALTKEMRLLFEIGGLKTATPATVSRAGILYINPQDLGWNPYVDSWIDQRENASEKSTLSVLFEKYVPPLLELSRMKLKKITPIPEVAMLEMTCFLLDYLLTKENVPNGCPKEWYEIYFTFAVIWGFGSTLFQDQIVDWRNEFNKWWINEFKSVKYPAAGTVFNYYIDPETKKFLPWTNLLQGFELDPDVPLQSTLVNTADTTYLRFFMDILIETKHPIMLVGSAGSGKSVIVADKLQTLSLNYAVTNVPFNFYTTSEMLQNVLEKPLERKAGRNYGPPGNKTMIYFIDDMNMPEVDLYGTVQPHTLVRQFMDYQHWYDRVKLSLKDIHNCQFVSCMNPTAGSFTIDPRLQRHFCTFAVNFPGPEAMYHIYFSILSQHVANPLNKFPGAVNRAVEPLVRTAISLHQRMGQVFLPTAVKFHYLFNLRDLANIFSGMMFANGECCPNSNMLIRLWVHEATRVYGDKLVDRPDIDTFNKLVLEMVRKGFEDFNESVVFKEPIIFSHFADGLADLKYMPVKEWAGLSRILEEAQVNYNELVGSSNLVLFEDAMSHICRINRILENARGYALLVGVGGSGKQSLTRLAAFISSLDVSQIQLRKGYAIADLKADLAVIYTKTAVKNAPCCFLMTDSQVAEESFLVLINDLLASGEIPELFADDEIENINGSVRNEVKQAGIPDTNENCWKYFIDKVRRMLKVVLCFSPIGATLRVRARKFPAVVNCCAINWFHEWPKDALESVSRRFLADIKTLPTELINSVAVFMAYVHGTVTDMSATYLMNEKRYNYTTPKSFLELISLYAKLLGEKHFEISDRIVRLENGLLKLAACAAQVDGLQEQLKDQEVVLKVKNEEADKLIVVVSAENEKVQKEKNFVSEEEKKVRVIEEEVGAKAKICEEDLIKAEPALIAAQEALNTLNKNNLTELKSFGSPPDAVVNVTAAVLVLFCRGKIPKDRSWKACKIMMAKVDQFLHDLVHYDKEHIHPDIIKHILPYINDPEFDPEKIRSKSGAAAGLCAWVLNIYKFYEVFLVVEPKQRALAEAKASLKAAKDQLTYLNNRIEDLQGKLDIIQTEYNFALSEKEKCQAEADNTANTIDLANRLVNGLASENVRWRESVKTFNGQIITLPGDCLLVCCFISYVGCFTRPYRIDLQQKLWLPTFKTIQPLIPVSDGADPLEMICDDAQVAIWQNEGLPSDRMSAENAIILTNSARWPLIIDPQLQGIKWIKQKYSNKLVVTRLTIKSYLDVIERAVSNGDVLLLENIGEALDAVLDPLLGRVLIKKGKYLKMGDREVDFNPSFRLILQTKLANPHYKPEMQAQTTLINFTVTRDGLEEQLLAEVVRAERPDLEKLKTDLTMQQNNFKITLKTLEDDLLQRLASAGENVLEDSTLVLNLEKTKKTAADVEIRVVEAKETSIQIDVAREQYRPAATRASIIYFILNDMFKIHPMYQFSLKAFTIVFNRAIVTAEVAEQLEHRVINLIDSITFSVYMYTSRCLFERDKLIFMAQMTIQILLHAREANPMELDFLLRFPAVPTKSPFDFLTNVGWGGIRALSSMDEFRSLDKDIEGSHKRWRMFVEAESPENEKFPGEWKNKNALQRLCIMRALRPDRMTYAVSKFIEEKLGKKYITARPLEFSKTFEESSNAVHMFFILSPGVDPLIDVEKMGKKLKFSTQRENFHNVSLGQGQEIVAENAMDLAAAEGHWVILQNVHLVARWLATLEKKIEATSENSHVNYRLFVSAEPAGSPEYHVIPQGILESAIKITNEPPTGMLANLHKALDNFNQETLEMCSKEAEFKAILFGLCYFHAVVAERRKFGPQGWNRIYPFNVGDLTISVYVLLNYLEACNKVPWEDLRYLFGEIMYGGHITDDWDRRLCSTYLEEYMQPELIDGELSYCPGFLAPPNTDYQGYHRYLDDALPDEAPFLYGLHSNAEIGFLTTLSENLFKSIFELQPRDAGSGGGVTVSREDTVKSIIEDICDKIPDEFNMVEIMNRVENKTPFVIVAFQECDRMNTLMRELRRSLNELSLGLKGELTITSRMEDLMESLFMDDVPESWTKLAYPSLMGLTAWFADLILRLRDLEAWAADFNLPSSVWLGGFFNPQSFLTAIMQQTARKNEWPLDRMCLNCDVTKKQKEDITAAPREGANINGLFMEGARWDTKINSIGDSILKELYPPMPVIYIKAVTQDKQDTKNVYECPVYKIRMRGPTYVWTFNLKTKEKAAKWTLAGVALLLQV